MTSRGKKEKEITELLYDCCYGKPRVEVGFPNNFESSKVNITAFERNLKSLLKKYDIAPPKQEVDKKRSK